MQQNLSTGFLTKRDSNQSPQLQRQARKMKFRFKQVLSDQKGQAGLSLCCSHTPKTGFLRTRPICIHHVDLNSVNPDQLASDEAS